MTHTHRKPAFREPRSRRSTSGGVVLVVALILLVVMTISSVVAMRGATASDMVSNNIRSQNLALQAAEMALRYCEGQVFAGAVVALELNDGTILDEWRTAANWTGATGVLTVPAAVLGTAVPYSMAPQCLVRLMSYDEMYGSINMNFTTTRPSDRGIYEDSVYIYRITARGFSPDFRRDASGATISGSQVWLQSTLRMVL